MLPRSQDCQSNAAHGIVLEYSGKLEAVMRSTTSSVRSCWYNSRLVGHNLLSGLLHRLMPLSH